MRNTRRVAAATLAVLGLAAIAVSVNVDHDPNPETGSPTAGVNDDGAVSLSMSVPKGGPVPLAMITEQARSVLGKHGHLGRGIDVALIDSGVTPVDGLDQPGKILYGPDLSNEGGHPNLANLDTFGHGTHLAGIIVGDDGDEVVGIAPDSRLVSVKVAGATGETNVAQVIAAIDWVVEHKNDNGMNIRVLNLSLGIDGVPTNAGDPLSAAVERAWHAGIIVVAAAGNRGNDADGIDSPAVSPYVIAVGATESYASHGNSDVVAPWSSGGNDHRTPDIVAPGRSIMSLRVPGSFLDQSHPTAVVDEDYFLGSGTSQSAAIVSGYAAALLSLDPTLTPDQVKWLFGEFAGKIKGDETIAGHGRFDPNSSARSTGNAHNAPSQTWPLAFGDGAGTAHTNGASWSGGSWNGASWSGGTWSGASWSGASWSGASWSGGTWSGASWSSASWSGASWSGASWSGASWSGASWSGASWSGASWSSASWS